MKDYPQNKDQWADEAYAALLVAWDIITQEHPVATDKQKEKLIEIAALMACENRDINDPEHLKHAQDYVKTQFMTDYENRDILQKINFSLCFVLAYFDAHLSLSMIPETLIQDAIATLNSNFNMDYEGKIQTNVLSVNFSSKKP